jgi:hypothetical protein
MNHVPDHGTSMTRTTQSHDSIDPQGRESLRQDVYTLATRAGRCVGTPGHTEARSYLLGRLREVGLQPYAGGSFELSYEGGALANLVGLLPGSDPTLAPILIGAHYDTCGELPGADDNAAAVAAVLDAVEPLRRLGLRRSVVVALFDGEEPPHFQTGTMGSIRFYQEQRRGEIAAAVVLDLVGHQVPVPGLEDLLFVLGAESSPCTARAAERAEVPSGLRVLPTLHDYAPHLSDHSVFERNGRPFLFLSCGHGPDYHQASDTPDKVDYAKLAAVRSYLVAVVARLDEERLERAAPTETLPFEIARWRGVWTPLLQRLTRLSAPTSREDIARIASVLRGGMGL